ncbi:hypothetical protein EVG20_g10037 [Dentipellis fragilis]|uniref:Uncharacterized protein n=1 Tax=Dentipellis fragilis TaxID=205917 RepID=A0A4Y9XV25_9AGAM|nr:hypothetical protein EVG20_g10037 [Dentipellis fragilis]
MAIFLKVVKVVFGRSEPGRRCDIEESRLGKISFSSPRRSDNRQRAGQSPSSHADPAGLHIEYRPCIANSYEQRCHKPTDDISIFKPRQTALFQGEEVFRQAGRRVRELCQSAPSAAKKRRESGLDAVTYRPTCTYRRSRRSKRTPSRSLLFTIPSTRPPRRRRHDNTTPHRATRGGGGDWQAVELGSVDPAIAGNPGIAPAPQGTRQAQLGSQRPRGQ